MRDWLPPALQGSFAESALALTLLAALALLVHLLAQRYLLRFVHHLVKRTRQSWDELLFEHRVPQRAALLIPLFVLQSGLAWIPGLGPEVAGLFERLLAASVILIGALSFDALISTAHTLYQRLPAASSRPIKSYVQLSKLFLYLIAAIFIVARLAQQTPWFFVSGLGAMMAIILLVFRDTLLSLVASIQLTNNDLIRVGDWIEMPQFDADGFVIDIALNTVRVQNWDRTVTVVPTHKFLEHSFKNWRHMFESGGRRIKRAIHINMSSVRFLEEHELDHFERFALLTEYIRAKRQELREHNAAQAQGAIVNARRLTNLGTLRAYITAYLRNHPLIHQEMTFLVRQLAPTPEGIPLEIYVFTTDTRWAYHESIQADIFDHILALMPQFDLRVYQRPSGGDFGVGAALEEGWTGPALPS